MAIEDLEHGKAFLQAIAKDRYDERTRRIFADWLEEKGFDSEAAEQRAWTKEKQEAEDYLREYAARLNRNEAYGYVEGDEFYEEEDKTPVLDYEGLLEAANSYLDTEDRTCLYFDTPNFVYDEKGKFWHAFELVTGRKVSKEKKTESFFSCSC